ncbi:virulence factor Mce family protein [Nocardioides terrae]|uniref:Virulence factor Mce family protein n=1 Tax=Nocardioides terrae TaxID=574651 RepID=A0A1I1KJL7_9ACTN|nr:MCE family protein [Nocardioides terrae]SFC60472.1 virulence factor Mce family protein [Nocardioides terrae]
MTTRILRWLVPGVIAILVVTAGVTMFTGGGERTLVAHFPRTVSIYEGSDVRVLGVPVGKVDEVTPNGTDVKVTMHYADDVQVPADAKAVIVAPSVVGDRFVQLTPAYTRGPVLEDGAVLDTSRTAVPLELDDIYGSLDKLVVALGPTGANKNGALSDLLDQTAKNFGGEGTQVRQTIGDFGKLSKTLDDNKDALFGSAAQLQSFVSTLAQNDSTVRGFNTSLSRVSTMLEGERGDLAASLRNLATALGDVTTFVRTNKDALHSDIGGLNRVAKVLVKRRNELNEVLDDAPLALDNLFHAYDPNAGTLDTSANLQSTVGNVVNDPSLTMCTILNQADKSGSLCNLVDSVLPRGSVFGAGTGSAVGKHSDPTLGGLVRTPARGGAR